MTPQFPAIDWAGLAPLLFLVGGAIWVLLWDAFSPRRDERLLAAFSLLVLALALAAGLAGRPSAPARWGPLAAAPGSGATMGGMYLADPLGLFFNGVILLSSFLSVLISVAYNPRWDLGRGEYYGLILFATAGMVLMASSRSLLVIFLGLEVLSLSLYILAGFLKGRAVSNESALKYFLLGSFASGFLLYGVALIYGATGSTDLARIAAGLARRGAGAGAGASAARDPVLLLGVGFVLVGFGFKLALVPFHMWTPDVYEGAPTAVTAFLSVGPKAAAFAGFYRFLVGLGALRPQWTPVLWALAALTMTFGNVVAIAQVNLKRMLAYSTIAHAGYMLIALVVGTPEAVGGLLYYLLAYTFMNLGAFAVLAAVGSREDEALNLPDYAGLGFRRPALALSLSLFLLALAGVPPTAGVVGKFYLFGAAVREGYVGLALVGVINTVISVYYYLRVVVYMYMREPEREVALPPASAYMVAAVALAVVGVLDLGLFPGTFIELARHSLALP
ncbi:MAG: NADH-quinone oxidoreductase subunit N [Nitrospinota bacterium]